MRRINARYTNPEFRPYILLPRSQPVERHAEDDLDGTFAPLLIKHAGTECHDAKHTAPNGDTIANQIAWRKDAGIDRRLDRVAQHHKQVDRLPLTMQILVHEEIGPLDEHQAIDCGVIDSK